MKTIIDTIGNTPLVKLVKLAQFDNGSIVLAKLEGNNPAGSVKDRPALYMIQQAQLRGEIKKGDTLIEATSGNTGIALAMASCIMGYKMKLIMPSNMSTERKASMRAYGAELIEVSKEEGMEGARDLANQMQSDGKGKVLNQFGNIDNPMSHYHSTAPEIYRDTNKKITHFVSSMGTTGTIMGVSRYLKEQNSNIEIIGVSPKEGASIPGIRRWPKEYLPDFYEASRIDKVVDVSQADAQNTMLDMAKYEGIFAGVSSGGAMCVALDVARKTQNSVVVSIVCDRGDRYLSTGVYD